MSGVGSWSIESAAVPWSSARTPPGQVWALRAGVMLALAVVLCFRRGAWRWLAGAALAGALLVSLAWLGHAGAGEDGRRIVMLAADSVHLLAAGFWPAGLVPFAILLGRLMRDGNLIEAHAAVRRFSAMSLFAVSALAISGLINACYLLGSVHALWSTPYGRFLLIKLTIFAIMLAVAAWNCSSTSRVWMPIRKL